MKKFLLGVLAVLIVLIIGVMTLVVVIDPNDYRSYITKQVKQSTGYELTLDGDLRWHVWPQISILSSGISLKDAGAKIPLLKAENMRLDVELFPLFSKQLSIKQVMVKGAVITISDDSRNQTPVSTATINQTTVESKTADAQSWQLNLDKLEVVDGVVVWQRGKNELVNFRDINILVSQTDSKKASVTFSGRVEQNQRNLSYSLNASVDLAELPNNISLVLNKLTYDLKGPELPVSGIEGSLTGTFNYRQSPPQLIGQKIELVANNNKISATLHGNLTNKPAYKLTLNANKLDLNQFIIDAKSGGKLPVATQSPVVSQSSPGGGVNELAFLNDFDAELVVKVHELLFKQITVSALTVDIDNKNGIAQLKNASAKLFDGTVAATGSANGVKGQTDVRIDVNVKQVELATLLKQLQLTQLLTGKLNLRGDFALNSLAANKLMSQATGKMDLDIESARLNNINIQQIVQTAIVQSYAGVKAQQEYDKYTQVQQLIAHAELQHGVLNITNLSADSAVLTLRGAGNLNVVSNSTDMGLNVRVLQGWSGNQAITDRLQTTDIPLRIYGDLNQLHYQLDVEKLLKDQLKSGIEQQLDKLKEKIPSNQGDAINSLLDRLKR